MNKMIETAIPRTTTARTAQVSSQGSAVSEESVLGALDVVDALVVALSGHPTRAIGDRVML